MNDAAAFAEDWWEKIVYLYVSMTLTFSSLRLASAHCLRIVHHIVSRVEAPKKVTVESNNGQCLCGSICRWVCYITLR